MHDSMIQRALITVFDKTHIIHLAEALHIRGIELISTGNTAAILKEHGLPVITVGEYTGFPEIMEGRLKTLHPKIHGGILGRRDTDADVMVAHHIPDIDLVVVNLYPFQKTSQDPNATLTEIIEHIDIGGPTLIRAAAKNYEWCTVLVDPNDYKSFITELDENAGAIKENTRFHFAQKAFAHTAHYDGIIANFFGKKVLQEPLSGFGTSLSLHYKLKEKLRYGENPHQQGAFYEEMSPPNDSIAKAVQQQGKPLSYNNIIDSDTALECVKGFTEPGCVIVKHANPCGVAVASTLLKAYEKAHCCDPISAFGGIIAFNQEVDDTIIQAIFDRQFCEIIIAPHFTTSALKQAKRKENCRLLQYHSKDAQHHSENPDPEFEIKSVRGGILVQSVHPLQTDPYQAVTTRQPNAQEMHDLLFSWHVAKFVKSNGIVYAKHGQTLGIGAGQMSRIFSTEIAALKAQQTALDLRGAVMASDAFFPFKDNIEKAHEYGIKAIIQPGGSKGDQKVIECANKLQLAMIFTGMRYFRH